MAARTTSQAGPWSAAATWGGAAAPGIGDTASIGHAVSVDVNTTVGTSPNDATTMVVSTTAAVNITVNAGITLTIRGNYTRPNGAGEILAAGAAIVMDNSASGGSPVYVWAGAGINNLVCNGTSGARCGISAIAGQTWTWHGQTWTNAQCTYTTISRLAASTMNLGSTASFIFTNCIWDGCGQITFNNAPSTDITFNVADSRWQNTTGAVGALKLQMQGALVTGSRTFLRNRVDKVVTYFSQGVTLKHNYFAGGITNVAAATWTYRYNLSRQDGSLNAGNGALLTDSVIRSYFIVDNSTGNPHFNAPTALIAAVGDNLTKQCIFEAHTPDLVDFGDAIIVNAGATTGGRIIKCTNNIALPNSLGSCGSGTLLTMFAADVNALSDWEHNTANVKNSAIVGARGMFAFAEGGAGFAGQVGVVKSNLAWSEIAGQGFLLERVTGNVKDIVVAAQANNNATFNCSTGDNQRACEDRAAANTLWTAGDAVAAGVDSNTVTTDPQLFDSARNIGKWCSDRGYGANDYTAGLAAIDADPTRVPDLVNYVFEGYRPGNAAHRSAGADNACVGAANWYKSSRSLRGPLAHRRQIARFGT